MPKISDRKKNYVNQFTSLTETYKKIIVAEAANVSSSQLQAVRKLVRGKGIVLMGKNSMMKKAIQLHEEKNPKLKALKQFLKGNIGLIFTNESNLRELRDLVNSKTRDAPAKAGQSSQREVIIPAQNTGMEPTKTSFFQALNIPTKISKGTVEIVNDFKILSQGQRVGNSEASLLQLLKINPFQYGLHCKHIYNDGTVYSPDVLDTSPDDMFAMLQEGLVNVSAVSLATDIPVKSTMGQFIADAFKNVLAISVETNYNFPGSEKVKEFLKDPSKFASAVVPQKEEKKEDAKKPDAGGKDAKKAEKPKEPEPPKKDEEDEGLAGGFDLFGGGE
jgi:large subunit ribosomal protein LP0